MVTRIKSTNNGLITWESSAQRVKMGKLGKLGKLAKLGERDEIPTATCTELVILTP